MPAATALEAGCEGVSAINTITSVMGVNLDTLRPEPCVEGYSTPGGLFQQGRAADRVGQGAWHRIPP